jgi:hypothetical protein
MISHQRRRLIYLRMTLAGSLMTRALLIDPCFAQSQRMRLGLARSFEGQFGVLQFLDLSHLIIRIENQPPALPTLAGAAYANAVNRMTFVLGHTSTFR